MRHARAALAAPPLAQLPEASSFLVFIRELTVSTVIGVYEHERRAPISLLMDLDIGLQGKGAGRTDRIADTVDYAMVVEAVRRELAVKRYFLLESVAEFVAALILDEFAASRVRVTVAKTGILDGVGRVGVAIERSRSHPSAAAAKVQGISRIARDKRRPGVSSISGK